MALAVTIGVVSLIAILAVATLSLASRLVQTSTLGLRDATLDAGVGLGLAAVTDQWGDRYLGGLAVGASATFGANPRGMPIEVSVTVTRIGPDLFWVSAEATSHGGAVRRESLILRTRAPHPTTLESEDSTNVMTLGSLVVDSIAALTAVQLPAGSTFNAIDGLMHVAGDATVTGGAASGVLIVEGRLTITGPLSYEGVIVARGGISIVVPSVTLNGVIRAAGSPPIEGVATITIQGAIAQGVLRQLLTPTPVAGRPWSETY